MKFDVIVIGGGWAGCTAAEKLADSGASVCVVSEGLSLASTGYESPYIRHSGLQKKGVAILAGDRVLAGTVKDGKVTGLYTRSLGKTSPLVADEYILATGKFFSRGLLSDKDHVWEPVFGADVEYEPDRSKWFNPDFEAPQPFLKFRVKTDEQGHVIVGGRAIVNLKAVGDICNE